MADEPLTPEEFDDLHHPEPLTPAEFDAGERKIWDDPDIAPMADADPPAADADPPALMEDGLEDVPPEEEGGDPEEEKPPVQNLVRQTQVKLPGKKGPLIVDSIGDYLEDADWNAIDEAAREAAELASPKSGDPEPGEDPDGAPPPPLPPEPVGDIGEPGEPVDPPVGDPGKPGMRGYPPAGTPDPYAAVVSAQPPTTSTNTASTSTTTSSAFAPIGPLATPEQLAAQPLADFGTHGTSSFDIPGQTSNASEDAAVKATDSVATATAAIVNILESFATTINMLSNRVTLIDNQLDTESDPDGG